MKNKTGKLLSLMLILALFLAVGLLPHGQAAYASTGTGTLDDPLIVTTPQELSDALDNGNIEYVKLGSDIDLKDAVIGTWGNRILVIQKNKIFDLNGYQLTHWGLLIRFYNAAEVSPTYGTLTITDSSPAGTGKIRTGTSAGINANTFSGSSGPDITHKLIIDDVDFVYAGDDHFSVLSIANTSSPSHKLKATIKNVKVSLYDDDANGWLSFADVVESEKNNITIDIQASKIESAKTHNSVQKTNNAEGLSADLSYFINPNAVTVKIDDIEKLPATDSKTLGKKIEVIGSLYTVTFDANGGSGAMPSIEVLPQKTFDLPENGFTTPDGKEFDKWEIPNYGKFPPGTAFQPPSDITVKALWKDKEPTYHFLEIKAGEHGKVSLDGTDYSTSYGYNAKVGDTVTLYAQPDPGYKFVEWKNAGPFGESLGTDNPLTFTNQATSPDVFYAYFEKDGSAPTTVKCSNYWGTSSDDAMTEVKLNGVTLTSNPSGTPVELTPGETVTITLKNADGWINTTFGLFYDSQTHGSHALTDNGAGVLSGSFTVPDVDFAIGINQVSADTTFDIHVNNGKASPASAKAGETVTLTADPAPSGKVFLKWRVEMGSIAFADEEAATTTFVMPAEYVAVTATYTDAGSTAYTVAFDAGGGSGTMPSINVLPGHTFDLPENGFTAPAGKEFDKWEIPNYGKFSPGTAFQPPSDITVKALWKDKASVNPFVDVASGDYFYDPVMWAVAHDPQITNGTDPTHFSPADTCTRGQIVTFLWRAKGCPEPGSSVNPFVDVKESDYYYKAVLWAVEQGVTSGMDATHFGPAGNCTRAQAVTFLWRAEGQPSVSGSNPFSDVASGDYYYDAVLWAVQKDVTKGTDATHFSPATACTRAQIVTFLFRSVG